MSSEDDYGLNLTPMKLAAAQLHEMYAELRKAGFARKEALYLVGKLLTSGMNDSDE